MDYAALELRLRKIVEKRLREGWTLRPGNYFDKTSGEAACCVLGSVVPEMFGQYDFKISDAVQSILGISANIRFGIAGGFDGDMFADDSRAVSIGANIRRIYCDDNGQVE